MSSALFSVRAGLYFNLIENGNFIYALYAQLLLFTCKYKPHLCQLHRLISPACCSPQWLIALPKCPWRMTRASKAVTDMYLRSGLFFRSLVLRALHSLGGGPYSVIYLLLEVCASINSELD